MSATPERGSTLAVDVSAVTHSQHEDEQHVVMDLVDNPVVAGTDPPLSCAADKPSSCGRSRVSSQGVDGGLNASSRLRV